MASPYSPAPPDQQQIRLSLPDAGVDLTRWTSYSFSSDVMTPADGWSVEIGDGNLAEAQRQAILIGSEVQLFVDDYPLATGFVDAVEISADRGRGVVYNIHGRDRLGAAVDAIADPRVQFKDGTTLAEFLKAVFAPYGWSEDDHFIIDNAANRDAKTGGLRGTPTSHAKKKVGKPLRDFTLHQLKPHNREGLFRFAARVAERHGFLIRCTADGEQLVIAGPDFYQDPRYQIRRSNDGGPGRFGGTNVLSGSVRYDGTDQPSIIVADGFSGGGEFGRGKTKSYCINPYFGLDEQGFPIDEVSKVLSQYPEAEPILFVTQPFHERVPNMPFRPMFVHDEESQTQEQLNWFVKRTMSELIRKSLVCHYTVEGHGQTVDGAFTPWDVDTVVDVQDDVGGVHERMYIIGRTFEKSRSGGTHTKLDLVRLFSIAVGDQVVQSGMVSNAPQKDGSWVGGRLTPRQ